MTMKQSEKKTDKSPEAKKVVEVQDKWIRGRSIAAIKSRSIAVGRSEAEEKKNVVLRSREKKDPKEKKPNKDRLERSQSKSRPFTEGKDTKVSILRKKIRLSPASVSPVTEEETRKERRKQKKYSSTRRREMKTSSKEMEAPNQRWD